MSIQAKQIGGSPEYNMLWEILKKLDQINKTLSSVLSTTTTTTAIP